jgi:Tol biopolymer transport system component
MKFSQQVSQVLIFILLLLTSCQAQVGSSTSLPLPKSVTEAVLVNFRPLTDSGRAIGAAWSPDGRSLAYTNLSFAPRLISFRDADAQPETQVWQTSTDEKNGKMLDIGTSLFYGKTGVPFRDGSEIFYQIYNPADGSPSIYAIDPATMKTRHFLGTQGYPSVHQLKDGRLVLSEVGTYEPLHIFNPQNGELVTTMAEHPSNAPQDARISPDGKWMAYPDKRAVYLSGWDGSSPKLLSDYGGGAAKVWWSPNSEYLAYTTGSTSTDQLLLTDRKGNTKTTLVSAIGQVGYIASVEWSPDSRWMLVIAESANPFEGPTRSYLFDREGTHTLILEAYLSASPAWSPDGHTLAIPFWIDPQGDEPVFDIWLADLTDTKTAEAAPLTAPPGPQPTPTLIRYPPGDAPDQVILRFWELINQAEYRAAWSMFSKTGRFTLKYPEFRAFYECFKQVSTAQPQFVEGDEDSQVFALTLDFQSDPACNSQWDPSNQSYVILVKPTAEDPWQIECLSGTPACTYEQP